MAEPPRSSGLTSREIIRRVLARDRPPRIGLTFSPFGGTPRVNDVAHVGPAADPSVEGAEWTDDGHGGEVRWDEWGCLWRRIQGHTDKGEVVEAPLRSWEDLATYRLPSLDDPARYAHGPATRERCEHLYLLGSLHGCAFNYARYLRRLEVYLGDCAAAPEQVRRLNRMLNDLAIAQVDIYADLGCDGVMIGEDWGTEDRLLVSPPMWHRLFKPDFERLVQHVHARGLTFWMHSCGYVVDIIPPLVELGVDVFQFDQPQLSGLERLSGHDVTYWCPIDIQRTLPTGDRALIVSRAREMLALLGGSGGGLIAKDYPDNASIGVDPLWQHWAYEVFVAEGVYA